MLKRLLSGFCLLLTAYSAQAVPIQWATNGNYYEFIDGAFSQSAAEAAASSSMYMGEQGYLATITSADEQAFLVNNWIASQGEFWIGGSDAANEGQWTWVTGPETGTVFYQGTTLTYSAWANGEPNDFIAGEDYLVFGWDAAGRWNDLGIPQFPNWTAGYIVEYGGLSSVPGPASGAILMVGLLFLGMGRRRLEG